MIIHAFNKGTYNKRLLLKFIRQVSEEEQEKQVDTRKLTTKGGRWFTAEIGLMMFLACALFIYICAPPTSDFMKFMAPI